MDATLHGAAKPANDPETFTRRVAQWGSLAAAALFATAYATEYNRNISESLDLFAYTACVVAIFAGYALAWAPRGEVVGSLIAIGATVVAYCVATPTGFTPVSPTFLLVALPAALHLVAVGLHLRHENRAA
jgi:hypothetical protein